MLHRGLLITVAMMGLALFAVMAVPALATRACPSRGATACAAGNVDASARRAASNTSVLVDTRWLAGESIISLGAGSAQLDHRVASLASLGRTVLSVELDASSDLTAEAVPYLASRMLTSRSFALVSSRLACASAIAITEY